MPDRVIIKLAEDVKEGLSTPEMIKNEIESLPTPGSRGVGKAVQVQVPVDVEESKELVMLATIAKNIAAHLREQKARMAPLAKFLGIAKDRLGDTTFGAVIAQAAAIPQSIKDKLAAGERTLLTLTDRSTHETLAQILRSPQRGAGPKMEDVDVGVAQLQTTVKGKVSELIKNAGEAQRILDALEPAFARLDAIMHPAPAVDSAGKPIAPGVSYEMWMTPGAVPEVDATTLQQMVNEYQALYPGLKKNEAVETEQRVDVKSLVRGIMEGVHSTLIHGSIINAGLDQMNEKLNACNEIIASLQA